MINWIIGYIGSKLRRNRYGDSSMGIEQLEALSILEDHYMYSSSASMTSSSVTSSTDRPIPVIAKVVKPVEFFKKDEFDVE